MATLEHATSIERSTPRESEGNEEKGFLNRSFALCKAEAIDFSTFRWTPAIIIAVYAFLNDVANWSVLGIVLPTIKRDWFGSDRKAGEMNAVIKGISLLGALTLAILMGHLSDSMGRRPMMILVALSCLVSNSVLYAFYPNPVPYMIVHAFNDVLARTGWGTIAAMLTDFYPNSGHRDRAISFFIAARMASSAWGLIVSVTPGGTDIDVAMYASLITAGLGVVYTVHFVPETKPGTASQGNSESTRLLNEDATKGGQQEVEAEGSEPPTKKSLFRIMLDVVQNKLLLWLIFSEAFSLAAWFGLSDVMNFYLNEHIEWDREDRARYGPWQDGCKVLSLLVVFPLMQRKLSPYGILLLGTLAGLPYILTVAFVDHKWMMYAIAAPLVGLGLVNGPPQRGFLALESPPDQRTMYQTTVFVITEVFSGVGQVLFGLVYGQMAHWVLFLIGAILQVLTILATIRMGKYVAAAA